MTANTKNKIEKNTLAVIYKIAKIVFPSCQSFNASSENAEKVVKPPNNPVIRSKLAGLCKRVLKNTKAIPIANEPQIFTNIVP